MVAPTLLDSSYFVAPVSVFVGDCFRERCVLPGHVYRDRHMPKQPLRNTFVAIQFGEYLTLDAIPQGKQLTINHTTLGAEHSAWEVERCAVYVPARGCRDAKRNVLVQPRTCPFQPTMLVVVDARLAQRPVYE